MWVYLDGCFVTEQDAKVAVTDHSFLYGDGCFEGIGVFNGRILHLDAHVERFFRSARMLRIDVPVDADSLRELILETAARNKMDASPQGYLRPVLSRGNGPMGLRWTVRLEGPTLAIIPQLTERRIAYGGETDVVSAITSTQVRAPSTSIEPRIKSNNYITSILAFIEAHDRGADVAIIRDDRGFISEGHAMNIFCVRDGQIMCPMESAALAGVTRSHVLTVARDLGLPVAETDLTAYDLICADEVFVTSSLEGVTAVGSVDGRPLEPAPGPLTARLRAAYIEQAIVGGTAVPSAEDAQS